MDETKDIVRLQHSKLDINEIINSVASPKSGAISTFIGTTRDNFESKEVLKLKYDAYEPMSLKEMKILCAKIRSQWEVDRIAIFHRLGEVPVLEANVVIAISSPHRKESLEAVQFTIDMLKASVPIWKKEIYANEESDLKENKECSRSSHGSIKKEMTPEKKEITPEKKEITPEEKCDMIDPSMIQVKADSKEWNRRIQAFISRKREQINLRNIQEFCPNGNTNCARVDAILTRRKDSKSHIKVHKVLNPCGPQTGDASTSEKRKTTDQTSNYPPALEERLSSTENRLGINKPVPRDIYERLKNIEDRASYLESLSPEYSDFWMGEQNESMKNIFKATRKRTFSIAELDKKIHELEDRYAKKIN